MTKKTTQQTTHLFRLRKAAARALKGARAVVRKRQEEPHLRPIVALLEEPLQHTHGGGGAVIQVDKQLGRLETELEARHVGHAAARRTACTAAVGVVLCRRQPQRNGPAQHLKRLLSSPLLRAQTGQSLRRVRHASDEAKQSALPKRAA